jgi:prepilin-type N-terminal cleavage/methylation domain-containing protein
MLPCRFRAPQSGFSLLELVAAIVVMGLMFAGFVTVYGTVLRQGAETQLQDQALATAAAYLDEILAQSYRDPDTGLICGVPEAGRPTFDNACDYDQLALNGCTGTSGACPAPGGCACDRGGAPVDGLRGFAVTVAVSPSSLAGAVGLDVQVTVDHAALTGGVTLTAFRAED